jgi:hypothetical protein
MSYLVAALAEARGFITPDNEIYWDAGQQEWVQDECISEYLLHTDVFTVISGPKTNVGLYPGGMAAAYIDFNATGEAGMSITINGVVYQEADTAAAATGVWTNGASAANSATSLIAAINGDTRAAVPFTAVADTSGDGVWLFWDAVGTAGNVAITETSSSNCTVTATAYGGAAATYKKRYQVAHTVSTHELLSGAVQIPIPFTPTVVLFNAYTSAGVPITTSDTMTIGTSPARIKFTTAGAGTHLGNTDVIHLLVFE